MKGLKYVSANARGFQGKRLIEGNTTPFVVYQKICQWVLQNGDKSCISVHCFLTLTWNLMCRSVNATLVFQEHMSLEGDAFGIHFALSKTDTTGDQASHIRHVFLRTRSTQWICPVLSLGRFSITFSLRRYRSFFWRKQPVRSLPHGALMEHADDIRALGIEPENIGVNSIRKATSTHCSSGNMR